MKLRDGKLRGSFRDGEIHHDELSNQSLGHDICRANAWMIEVLTTTKGTIRNTFFLCTAMSYLVSVVVELRYHLTMPCCLNFATTPAMLGERWR